MDKFELNKKSKSIDLKVKFEKAKENPNFVKIINNIDLPVEVLRKYTSTLEEAVNELENCSKCKGLEYCKNSFTGHVLCPEILNENLVFDEIPCKYYLKNEEIF